jgi:G3E family GTPase
MHLIIVSGMLGVGKTSVILKMAGPLMKEGKKVVIIENDFGAMGVDSEVLEKNGLMVRDLKGGCVCCTLKANLIDDLRLLNTQYSPDTVIVEPTGIADPSYILSSLDGVPGLGVDRISIVDVIDAERFVKTKKMFERPMRNHLKVADLVLLNKVDTVDDAEISEITDGIREFGYSGVIMNVRADIGTGIEQAVEAIEN